MNNYALFITLFSVNLDPPVELFREKAYVMFLKLSRIFEKVMCQCIRYYEVEILENEIIEYLDLRKDVFQEFPSLLTNPKPKHHFSNHYSQSILKYGPCPATWTARYESKNRVAKLLATSAKNFINISLTVCRRQQMRQASIYYEGMFNDEIMLPIGAKQKFELNGVSTVNPLISEVINFMDNNSLLCEEINVCNQMYKVDDIIVLKAVCTDFIEVGLIEKILYKEKNVYFVVYKYVAKRNENYNFFETLEFVNTLHFIRYDNVADYKPLVKYGVVQKFRFVLHHHISVCVP